MSYNFGIALKQKKVTDGLKRWEILDLYDKIEFEKEVYPVEFEAREQECSAMGFITAEAANRFDYDYEESGLHDFIALILDHNELESIDPLSLSNMNESGLAIKKGGAFHCEIAYKIPRKQVNNPNCRCNIYCQGHLNSVEVIATKFNKEDTRKTRGNLSLFCS